MPNSWIWPEIQSLRRAAVLDDLAYGHLESIDADIPFYQDLLVIERS
jgi:hypothetical protein